MSKIIDYSIVIPTHNSSSFIQRLFDSIPLIGNVEVIVIDDHSSEHELKKTKEIFAKYTFSHKLFLINDGIRSAGAARNIGINSASGRWLVFADSDDHFTHNFKIILDSYKKRSSDLVLFQVKGNGITHRVNAINSLLKNEDIERIKYLHVVPWGKLISRELIEKYNIRFSEVTVSNDELFSAKVGYYSKSNIIEKLDGYYSFERNNSLTTQTHDIALQDIRMNEVLEKYMFLDKQLEKNELRKIKLSVFSNIRKSISVGGIKYGIKWYTILRRFGARMNIFDLFIKKVL